MVLAAPILLNIVTILIVLFAPFRELRAELKFRLNKPEYEKIVKQIDEDIRSGKIKTLPAVYQYQSNSIESIIIYHKTKLDGYVIYFSNDVTFTSQSGLFYLSTDCDLDVAKCVSAPFGSFETIRYLEPNWYVFRLWILE
jgi:hypothetical protein